MCTAKGDAKGTVCLNYILSTFTTQGECPQCIYRIPSSLV